MRVEPDYQSYSSWWLLTGGLLAPGGWTVRYVVEEGSLKVVEAQEGSLKCEANRFEHQGCRLRRCVF